MGVLPEGLLSEGDLSVMGFVMDSSHTAKIDFPMPN